MIYQAAALAMVIEALHHFCAAKHCSK